MQTGKHNLPVRYIILGFHLQISICESIFFFNLKNFSRILFRPNSQLITVQQNAFKKS